MDITIDFHKSRYNVETEAAIQEAKDMISGKIQGKVYSSLKEFSADLESENEDI